MNTFEQFKEMLLREAQTKEFEVGKIYALDHGQGDEAYLLVASILKNGNARGLVNEPEHRPSTAVRKSITSVRGWQEIKKTDLPPKALRALGL